MNATIEAGPSVLSELPVRFGHLKAYGRSAAHGKHARMVEAEQTYAMERGTALHALVFDTRKVCGYPGKARYGKEFDAFAAERADFEILTMAEYDKARRMADAVRSDALAMSVLVGEFEKTLRFRWHGLDCRTTPDCRGPNYLTELKSSSTVDPARFPWHAIKMAYHAQMAMQSIGVDLVPGQWGRIRDCYIVAIEAAEPFPVQVYRLDERALDVGHRLLMLWAETMKHAEAMQSWPAYSTTILPIDVESEEVMFVEEEA